jgi:hypothetical protein
MIFDGRSETLYRVYESRHPLFLARLAIVNPPMTPPCPRKKLIVSLSVVFVMFDDF